MATITESRHTEKYDLKAERGKHVRLDWPAGQLPTELTDQRAVAARLTAEFAWRPAFFAQFSCDKAQEPSYTTCEAVVCLFSFDSWLRRKYADCLSSPCVVRLALCPRDNDRSSSRRINDHLVETALEFSWTPTWANPADVPSRFTPLATWYSQLPELSVDQRSTPLSLEAALEMTRLHDPFPPPPPSLEMFVPFRRAGEHVGCWNAAMWNRTLDFRQHAKCC